MIERIIELRKLLNKYNHAYYVQNNPMISDREFDRLMAELIEIEKKHPEYTDSNSPSKRVGSDLTNGFEKVRHNYPMLSISNTYSKDEFFEFANKLKNAKSKFVGELKFDGASIAITYINRKLKKAVTRGDGEIGDDVTENIRTIKSIPLVLPENAPNHLEVRGEIVLPKSEFNLINEERAKLGEKLYANPRNTASGTLKLHSPAEVSRRKLDAYFYQLIINDAESLPVDARDSHYARMQYLKSLGFKINSNTILSADISEIYTFIKKCEVDRKSFEFDIDGIVIKLDSLKERESVGFTSNYPKWATAYKFETERALTKMISIDLQVGRTGVITPVANLEPVTLCGTIVKRATLNNFYWTEKNDIKHNDYVYVEKGGEIIPKIVGVDRSKRTVFTSSPINPPKNCPVCNHEVYKDDELVDYFCSNPFCEAQVIGKLVHFASKDCMNINGFGEAIISQLVSLKIISKFSDIYKLSISKLMLLERSGHASSTKLLQAIQDSKKMPFEKVLYSLGIPKAGEVRVKDLVKKYKTVDALKSATIADLCSMDKIQYTIANSIKTYIDEIWDEIVELKNVGLNFSFKEESLDSNSLSGKSFCITGTLSKTRDYFKKLIESNGGEFHSSIKKNTTFLLVGDDPGQDKINKIQTTSTKILKEDEFLKMLN